MAEIEKTCDNCKYDYEDEEGTHCRHCIHNAIEHFEPKEIVLSEAEIRNKAITEFAEEAMTLLSVYQLQTGYPTEEYRIMLRDLAEQMKGGE